MAFAEISEYDVMNIAAWPNALPDTMMTVVAAVVVMLPELRPLDAITGR